MRSGGIVGICDRRTNALKPRYDVNCNNATGLRYRPALTHSHANPSILKSAQSLQNGSLF